MGSVELTLAISEYADYYVASAEVEPGFGQDYRGWVSALGANPDYDSFELGKMIVDDYIYYYGEDTTSPGYGGRGTLATIDTAKLMESGFPEALNEMNRTLESQVSPQADGEFLYYDELRSVDGSIRYSQSSDVYRDFGNLAGQLCIAFKEVSANNIRDGSFTILNAYADSSRTLCTLLGNQSVVYARGTWGVAIDAAVHMDGSGALSNDKLSTSGLYLLTPTMNTTEDVARYHDEITAVANKLSNEKSREFLSN